MATGTQLEKSPPRLPGSFRRGGNGPGCWGLAQVRWAQMAAAQRAWVVAATFLLIALIGGLAWYAMRPDWRTLYVNLDPDDARQMGQILAQAQIPFEATADGAGIRVPAAQLDKARLATAAKGGVEKRPAGI